MNENSTIIKEILSLRYCPSLKIDNEKFVSSDFMVQEKPNYLEYIENLITKKIQNEIHEKRISVAAPILGSPKWKSSILESPHHYPQYFSSIALLSQNAGLDTSVPAKMAREFHEILKPYYKKNPKKLNYIEFPNSDHFMREEDWEILWNNTLEWFETHL